MDFISFCRAHGILIDYHPPIGVWARFPTEDHPHKKNGAVKFLGDAGFAQNHATMQSPAAWFPESRDEIKVDLRKVRQAKEKANQQIDRQRQEAARKAAHIISQSKVEQHAYLDSKGFPDASILVYRPSEDVNLCVIPMRVGKQVVGVQLIDRDGNKKFLFGQRCSGAEFVIGTTGINIWCEGFATALSIQRCVKVQCKIHVCFSAHNLASMATDGFVVGDNDASGTGESAAKKTGLPYFIPPQVGQDFNDLMVSCGRFKASQLLMDAMRNISCKHETV